MGITNFDGVAYTKGLYTGVNNAEIQVANSAGEWLGGVGSGTITTDDLANSAVTTPKIANSAVTSAKIISSAVTTAKIATSAVTSAKIAVSAVSTVKIATSAVTSAKITTSAVTSAKIAASAVTSAKIANSAVTNTKLGPSSVTENKIHNNAVTNAKIANSAVTSAKIADGTIVNADINTAAAIVLSKLETVPVGTTLNLGMTLSSGTFSITSADGSALSSTNRGFVKMQSVTEGQTFIATLTSDQSFEDDNGTSDIIGEEFGVTSGVAWNEDRPFYLYAVNSDDTNTGTLIALSPNPTAKVSPGSNAIGYHGNPATNQADTNFFFLTATDVTTTHQDKPCQLIGGIRMRMSSSDDWTVQTLSSSLGDGIRLDPFVGSIFNMPLGQNGASSNNFFGSDGTEPTWASPGAIEYKYSLGLDGFCDLTMATVSAGTVTNGSGGNGLNLALPYLVNQTYYSTNNRLPAGFYTVSGASQNTQGFLQIRLDATAYLSGKGVRLAQGDSTSSILDDDFTSAGDDITASFKFKAF